MPDKRDMHKAKSHRNAKNKHQVQPPAAGPRRADTAVTTATVTSVLADTPEAGPTPMGKKNKSKR